MNFHRTFRCGFAALYLIAASLPLGPTMARASEADDLDTLMAPIALYPDALLAQILTAATSPEQVTEFEAWLGTQELAASELQEAAMEAKFDAAFASLAIFPDVVKMMADNIPWTTEIGTCLLYTSDAADE